MQSELNARHRVAALAIGAALGVAVALTAFALLGGEAIYRPAGPRLPFALWIAIMVCGLGAFVYRRFMFAGDRLRDIGVLRGTSGLLRSLQTTTVQLALIGITIALLGFVIMIATGNKYDMVRAGAIAVIVLLYSFPQKGAWQRVATAVEKVRSA
jgi:hypothetical protein